jgi:hypothetical protein
VFEKKNAGDYQGKYDEAGCVEDDCHSFGKQCQVA